MPRVRTDTLPHLIEDLRRDHPRLVVIFGERHDCNEGHKLFSQVSQNADVGFFEVANIENHPTGYVASKEDIRGIIDKMRENDPTNHRIAAFESMLAPRQSVMVDIDNDHPVNRRVTLASEAAMRLSDDNVPMSDPVMSSVAVILAHRKAARVDVSNEAMGGHMRDYIAQHFGNNTPFFGVALVGNEHLKSVHRRGMQGKANDLAHVLRQQGCHVVTIDLVPEKAIEDDKPGDHMVIPTTHSPGIDYRVDIVDPAAYESLCRGRLFKRDDHLPRR